LSQSERRLAAIMFTDMVGYTALGQRNESLSLALVEEQRKLIRPIVARHNGKEIKTMGDAFLVEFPNALDAVRCAYDIQRATREFNVSLAPESRIHLRVGLHLGDVVESRGDISGDAVNVASRIEPLAEDGNVCLTRQVYDHVQNKFELPLTSLGNKSLKNVSAPLEVFKMAMPWDKENSGQPANLDKRRIAVLPFSNMSPDPNDEYFADGMTEELISTLSNVEGLTIVSRTSTAQYKAVKRSVIDIGRELKAGTLLEGSVRKAGTKLRITIQLIDSTEDRHLFAQNYDRELTDIFAVQSDIARRVAETLRVQLLAVTKQRIAKLPTQDVEAHTYYLQGLHLLRDYTGMNITEAIRCLDLAVSRDPNFALAYAALSEAYAYAAGETLPEKVGFEKAMKNALKAIDLDDGLADAHASLGILALQFLWDWPKSESELKRAIELNPSHAIAQLWYGSYLMLRGRFEEGLEMNRRVQDLDPLSGFAKMHAGWILLAARRYDESIVKCREVLAIEPEMVRAHTILGFCYGLKGLPSEALAEMRKSEELTGGLAYSLGPLAYALAKAGLEADAKMVIDRLKSGDRAGITSSFDIALALLGLGDNAGAIEYLEKAYDDRSANITLFHPGIFPMFDPLRSNARFQDILKNMAL